MASTTNLARTTTFMASTTPMTTPVTISMTSTSPSSSPGDNIFMFIVPIVSILVTLSIILCMMLIPIIIINNRRRRRRIPTSPHTEDSEQPNTTGELVDEANIRSSQTAEDEIETSGTNHFYDDLMNFQAQEDNSCNHINHRTNTSGAGLEADNVEKTEHPAQDTVDSGNHMYAVLEGPVPPVPERTYRVNTHATETLAAEEQNSTNGRPSQNFDLEKETGSHLYDDIVNYSKSSKKKNKHKERPHTLADIATLDGEHTSCDGPGVGQLGDPNNHTYAVLEGPMLPIRRHKAKSVGAKEMRTCSNESKSDGTAAQCHVYDTLGLETGNESDRKIAHLSTSAASATENPDKNQYAVLEGPTTCTPIEHSDTISDGKSEIRKGSLRLSMHTVVDSDKTAAIGYDKLAPKPAGMDNTGVNRTQQISQENEGHSATEYHEPSTPNTTYYDRLNPELESESRREMVDAALLGPNKSVKPNKGKTKSKKKQKQKQKQTSADQGIVDASHVYDVLEFKSQIASRCGGDMGLAAAAATTTVAIGTSENSCESNSVNAPHKRRIAHSFSSRMLCETTEVRKRSLTTALAASDTKLNRIDTDAEAHVYDTIELFPVSKRKRRQSGKRYRWLYLKEQLQRQDTVENMDHPMDTNHMIPISSHVTTTATADLSCEANTYASLDKTQTYAQVGPFIPDKRGTEVHKPVSQDSSEYAHLQHQ